MIIYVDGACSGNGKQNSKGGFGMVVYDDNKNLIDAYSHYEENTTNNIQELKAILRAMLLYGSKTNDIPLVYSDSDYCVNTFNEWMFSWQRNNWRKSDKKPPENLELIKAYWEHYQKGYRIELRKIKGHNGYEGNEFADQLATGKIIPEDLLNKKGELN